MPAVSLIPIFVAILVDHVIKCDNPIDTQLLCSSLSSLRGVPFSENESNVLHNYVPLKLPSGDEEVADAKNFTSCLSFCCLNEKCRAVFYVNNTTDGVAKCYNLLCTVDKDSCSPVLSKNTNSTSVFVSVRNLTRDNLKSNTYGHVCDKDSTARCDDGQICVMASYDRKTCQCTEGAMFLVDKCVQLAPTSIQNVSTPCTIGMNECDPLPYEECKVEEERVHSKRGKCACLNGYVRNEKGVCVVAVLSDGLSVAIVGPSVIHLPINQVSLFANVSSTFDNFTFDDIKYEWNIISSPKTANEGGNADGRASKTLLLKQLDVGEYILTVTIGFREFSTTSNFSLTVLPAVVPNMPPKAIIVPEHVDSTENKKIILDGSSSKDASPGHIVEWAWQYVDGPINSEFNSLPRSATLNFEKLKPGNYTFKLTVKDDEGAEDSALATVSIAEEIDYPPKANPGSCDSKVSGDMQVRLPLESIFICGNSSTDDKAIVKWKWTLKDTKKNTADMDGTSTPVLKVSNVQPGDYTFTLEVEDAKGQRSTADVRVVVLPKSNSFPVANAGANATVLYPENSIILDGRLSGDDGHIVAYRWRQISGPNNAKLTNADKDQMTASDLTKGIYRFRLNVTDDLGLSAVSDVFVTVDESKNSPPVAKVVNMSITLPATVVLLNGSLSTDDAGIVKWHWSLLDNSPAGLVFLGNSRDQPVLMISGFTSPGLYYFNLTVCDKQNACNSAMATLTVLSGENEQQSIEIYLNTKLKEFTMKHQRKFVKQLGALLATNKQWDEVDVHVLDVSEDPTNGKSRLVLYCEQASDSSKIHQLLSSKEVVDFLDVHLSESDLLLDFNIDKFDTKYCRNTCSGHGTCNDYTKHCTCERYWMPNFFKARFPRHSNCDWSVLYFVLVVLLMVFVVFGSVLATYCSCNRIRLCTRRFFGGNVVGRPRKYRTLSDSQLSNKSYNYPLKKTNIRGKNGYANFADSDSDSLLSSEEETVYDRSSLLKPSKSSSPNGVVDA